jgi:carboxymethylenebutenolidase
MADVAEVSLGEGSGAFPGVLAKPEANAKGGIVVVQEAFGITSHIRTICTRLADAGYVAIAPALFHRQGAPVFSYEEIEKAMPVMAQLRSEEILADIQAALVALSHNGIGQAHQGIFGFCMGGTVALAVATEVRLGAAVSFYGGGVTEGRFGFRPLEELAPQLLAPWLGLYGDKDASIPIEHVERLRASAAKASVPTEIVRYPEAGHGFNCDERSAYEPGSAQDAWRRTIAFFDAHLAGASR